MWATRGITFETVPLIARIAADPRQGVSHPRMTVACRQSVPWRAISVTARG